MRRLVVDAGALVSWFDPHSPGRALRVEYEAGALTVIAPRTILADALAVVVGRTGWPAERLRAIATELGRLGLDLRDPDPIALAPYLAAGLAADRAAYPALATELDVRLVTDDPAVRRVAARLLLS